MEEYYMLVTKEEDSSITQKKITKNYSGCSQEEFLNDLRTVEWNIAILEQRVQLLGTIISDTDETKEILVSNLQSSRNQFEELWNSLSRTPITSALNTNNSYYPRQLVEISIYLELAKESYNTLVNSTAKIIHPGSSLWKQIDQAKGLNNLLDFLEQSGSETNLQSQLTPELSADLERLSYKFPPETNIWTNLPSLEVISEALNMNLVIYTANGRVIEISKANMCYPFTASFYSSQPILYILYQRELPSPASSVAPFSPPQEESELEKRIENILNRIQSPSLEVLAEIQQHLSKLKALNPSYYYSFESRLRSE